MASYADIYKLSQEDAVLRQRITVACLIAAEAIRSEADTVPNHANRMTWAKAVFASPSEAGARMLMAVLAKNNAMSVALIQGATDAQLQAVVNNAVNVFATGA